MRLPLLCAALCGALLSGCRLPTEPPTLPEGDPAHVGSYLCRMCHEEVYAAWSGSLHARVISDPAESPELVLGDFRDVDPNGLALEDMKPDFSVEDLRLTHGQQWKQRYVDREWRIRGAQWNLETSDWAPFHTGEWADSDWRVECAGCHTVNWDPESLTWTELNVGCESCHGPGGHHVNVNDELKHETITNPDWLTPMQSSSICGTCHNRGETPEEGYPYPVAFEIGQVLGPQHYASVPYEDGDRWWPSGHLKAHRQQFPDWARTTHAEAGVGCADCHEPHGNRGKYLLRRTGNGLCLECHQGISTDPETGHVPMVGAPQHSNCRGCHMPRVGKSAILGDDSSHRFDVIEPQETIDLGGGDLAVQPNSCNSCHEHEDDAPEMLQRALDLAREQRATARGDEESE